MYVDQYCERIGPGLLGEPVNAATNVAFFIAAWGIWRYGPRVPAALLVAALVVAIGIGSTTFHMVASTAARWGDLVPILLFQLAFLWLYARSALGWRAFPAAAFVAAFLAAALYARTFPEILNGSLTYAPTIAVLAALGIVHYRSRRRGRADLLAAGAIFAVSLVFRTIDESVCVRFPLGTHFLWHLLNPVVIYLCARALLRKAGGGLRTSG